MASRRAAGPLSNELRDEGGIEFAPTHFCFFCSGIHHVYFFCGILRLGMMFRSKEMREEMLLYTGVYETLEGGGGLVIIRSAYAAAREVTRSELFGQP